MSFDILKQDIKNKRIRSLYLFYGPEEFLKKYYLEEIERILLKDGFKELNRIVLEGKTDIAGIIENCETLPVFCEKKIVIVKNSGLFKAKGKTADVQKAAAAQENMVSCLQNVPNYTCLVFCEDGIDARIKAVETVKKNGLAVEFAFRSPTELAKWVENKFKSAGKKIDPAAADLLVEYSEPGMNDILNEISKIEMYLGDRIEAGVRDIEEACAKTVKSRIFDLIDAIAARDGTLALRILRDMIFLKEPVSRILFLVGRQFKQILQLKLLAAEGMSLALAAEEMGISVYVAGKIQKQAAGFAEIELKRAMEKCLNLDEAIKTGKMNESIAVELLIAEFAK